MAGDARAEFLDGMRVTADHMRHLQQGLQDSVRDLRRVVGLRKIAWGLRVSVSGNSATIQPGVALAPSGVRLNVDSAVNIPVPAGQPPFRVVLKAAEQDRASLRLGDEPTLILLVTAPAIEPATAPDPGPDSFAIARLELVNGVLAAVQDGSLFAPPAYHRHSGGFVDGADGIPYYDGAPVEGAQGPKGDPGEPGTPGTAGVKGDKGDPGEPGTPGTAGDKGDKGDPGTPGTAGTAGVKGDKGDKGDPGTPGTAGTAGVKGDKGDKGDPGTPGTAGTAGVKGDKGDKGDPGTPGTAGTAGVKGDKGDKGDPGTPGTAGTAGVKGDKGDKGDPGTPGTAGTAGVKGDKGDPGAGLDLNPTRIRAVSWKHDTTIPITEALNERQFIVDLTAALHPEVVQRGSQVMQVWFEPNTRDQATIPASIMVLRGSAKFDDTRITWTMAETPAAVRGAMNAGGRMLIRIHCGYLFDTRGRPVSASLNAVAQMANPSPVYGGVFESWFFVG